MKRLFTYIAVALFALCSCGPMGDDVELALVNADPDALLYTFDHQTVRLKMDCNRSWKASCSDDWIELVTPKGGEGEAQDFKFSLTKNPKYTYRTGEIVIKAGDRSLVLTVTQEPELNYLVKENFYSRNLILEGALPSGWSSQDNDGDGFGWRCWRDPETEQTFAYSCSFESNLWRSLTPDNWMITPRFTVPSDGFSVKWDTRGSDAEYLGDKYEVCVGYYENNSPMAVLATLCQGETTSATELTHYSFNLDAYKGRWICIAFHHYDSEGLARVLVTNVEVSNSR